MAWGGLDSAFSSCSTALFIRAITLSLNFITLLLACLSKISHTGVTWGKFCAHHHPMPGNLSGKATTLCSLHYTHSQGGYSYMRLGDSAGYFPYKNNMLWYKNNAQQHLSLTSRWRCYHVEMRPTPTHYFVGGYYCTILFSDVL